MYSIGLRFEESGGSMIAFFRLLFFSFRHLNSREQKELHLLFGNITPVARRGSLGGGGRGLLIALQSHSNGIESGD